LHLKLFFLLELPLLVNGYSEFEQGSILLSKPADAPEKVRLEELLFLGQLTLLLCFKCRRLLSGLRLSLRSAGLFVCSSCRVL